jgi:hypothetical protein
MRKKSKFAERWQGMDALQKREWYTNVLNIVVKGGKKNNSGSSKVKQISEESGYTYPLVRFVLHGKVKVLREHHYRIMEAADTIMNQVTL